MYGTLVQLTCTLLFATNLITLRYLTLFFFPPPETRVPLLLAARRGKEPSGARTSCSLCWMGSEKPRDAGPSAPPQTPPLPQHLSFFGCISMLSSPSSQTFFSFLFCVKASPSAPLAAYLPARPLSGRVQRRDNA